MKLKITCREATHLLLDAEHRRLGAVERVWLWLHWRVCDACRRFRRQNATMRQALDRWRAYRDE